MTLDPEIESHWEDEGYKCPYCKHQYTCDDWGNDYDYQIEKCEYCGNKFRATAHTSTHYESEPDCNINGLEHNYVYDGLYKNFDSHKCTVCGDTIIGLKKDNDEDASSD